MPQISKIRIVNFNYNDGNRFIPDELYDLASPDTGKALNTLFNLNNGGGKTVLVQLMMQPVHPRAMAGGRRIEDYFSHTGDHSYILLEWNLDGSKEKLLTGISIAASSSASTEEDKRGNSVKYYTFTTHYDTFSAYSISSLELSSNDNGNYVPAQFDYVREKAKSSRGLLTYYSSDDAVKWAEFLAEYGIFRTEWESVIEVLNKDEGGLNQYFDEAKTSDKLIAKFFIPAIEQKLMSVASKGTDCLGSNQEINDNFISAEAAVLDQIQYENDVIFVVAGTNKSREDVNKIGSPADSINSMVVNAVTKSGLSTKYSRKGLALSFFAKPDVSYYGGSEEQYIQVCEPLGATFVAGTSFAAPWIARKLAYLIDVLGLNREIAKALIIDAARGWNDAPTPEEVALYGHGIVPIKITDIIQTPEDEIRFLVTDVSEKWNTYNYHFPIPLKADTYPYYARATMCYFPLCDRAQGVDYTNTELNLHFGRIQDDGKLNEINDDKQNLDDIGESRSYILEGDARERFRKWDNVKYVAEKVKDRRVPKKSYRNKNWGMEIKTNNRLDPEDGVGLRFGVVVTIKEMYGINRIDEFIKNCNLNGWLVNAIDIQNRIEIHEKINEEIRFD